MNLQHTLKQLKVALILRGMVSKPVSQWSESQTAEDVQAKWLASNNRLQDKETTTIKI
jgi:hypothetical protein